MYSGGYNEVWTSLKKRYDNPRQLADIHVSRFLDIIPVTQETSEALLKIVDTVRETFRALSVMKLPVESWDAIAVPILSSKLPAKTKIAFSMSLKSDIPKLEDLLSFLENKAQSLLSTKVPVNVSRVKSNVSQAENKFLKCLYCKGEHHISRCSRFLELSQENRFEWIKQGKLCFNCLKSGHLSSQCLSGKCRNCNKKHNTVLCKEKSQSAQDTTMDQKSSNQLRNASTHFARGRMVVLLATARAYANDKHNNQILVRILCDPGSQVSFISEKMASQLGLQKTRCSVSIEGVGSNALVSAQGIVNLKLFAIHSNYAFSMNAYVLPNVTSTTPSTEVDTTQWSFLEEIQLADPYFGTPDAIDVLLGADVWSQIVQDGILRRK